MTILEKIIAHKRREVEILYEHSSFETVEKTLYFEINRPTLRDALEKGSGIIAEFKRRSPSKGWINQTADASEIAAGYERAGASALSILTDEEFFGGDTQDLIEATVMVKIPLLRKDFIIDEIQIVQARVSGASVILLIAAALSPAEIKKLAAFARRQDLEVLLEVHKTSEIPDDLENISAVGVNNRNLKDFSVDVGRSFEIAAKLPPEILKISESGLRDAQTILELKQAGFQGFLIGEIFMKTRNPAQALQNLIREINHAN